MAVPFLSSRQQLLMAVEATEGSAETLVAADVIAPVFGLEYDADFDPQEREVIQPSFSRIADIQGERFATITFQTEMKGSGAAGTVPGNLSVPMQCAGWGETIVVATSVTYAPASASIPSCTAEVRELEGTTVARIKQLIGARGTMTISHVKGQIVMAEFEFMGRYVEPTEGVAVVMPSIAPQPLPFLNAGISLHGVGLLLVRDLQIDLGNRLALRNDANEASGNFSAAFTGRNPRGNIIIEAPLIGTFNSYNKVTTNAEGILLWALNGGAGNIMTYNAPVVQLTDVEEADDDGIRLYDSPLKWNQSAAAGDDEQTYAFT